MLPGQVLTAVLEKRGIREKSGCPCHLVALKMNKLGKKGCEKHFSEIVKDVENSIKQWRRINRKVSNPDDPNTTFVEKLIELKQPPTIIVEQLVQYCIDNSD